MASFAISPFIPSSAPRLLPSNSFHFFSLPLLSHRRLRSPARASDRLSSYHKEKVAVVLDPGAWVGDIGGEESGGEDDDYYEEDEEEQDQSLDLIVGFLYSVFRKISRSMRKAARSVLPPFIPSKLVGFSVNGVLILAFLWILKAFLEVVCTLGSMVFVSMLLVRGIWSFVTYTMENQYNYASRNDEEGSRWSAVGAA
ncbi:unnamed protein product [Musa hybrid cultivar]